MSGARDGARGPEFSVTGSIDIARREGAPEAWERRRRLAGIGLMCLALIGFTGIDSSAKWLGHTLPPLEIAFFRNLVAFLAAAAIFAPWRVPGAWRSRRPLLQIVRGLCLLGSTVFNFMALRHLQLAETMSISFSAPMMIALLSAIFLGERIGLGRWVLIAVGFAGVLVVAQPTAGGFQPAMLLAFANVACYAVYAIVTRKLAGIDTSASMLIISAGLPVVALAPWLPAGWVWPEGLQTWIVLVIMGLCGAAGHFLLILSFARAPASVVAPFTYTQILWMTLSGWLLFGDVPGTSTLAGGAIVVTSGLLLLWLEHRPARPSTM